MQDNTPKSSDIVCVRPLLNKATHLLGEISKLALNATPDKYEKRAKAIGEMYKTATIIETYNASHMEKNQVHTRYEDIRAASPEEEAALREELLRYYDRIHAMPETGEDFDESSGDKEQEDHVRADVAADSAGRPASAE